MTGLEIGLLIALAVAVLAFLLAFGKTELMRAQIQTQEALLVASITRMTECILDMGSAVLHAESRVLLDAADAWDSAEGQTELHEISRTYKVDSDESIPAIWLRARGRDRAVSDADA